MLFNSIEFIYFLPIVFIFFYSLPIKGRQVFFLLASYFFYGFWKIEFLPLIIFSTIVDYFCGVQIPRVNRKQKKIFLVISLICNLGLLFSFKYLFFFTSSINDLFELDNSEVRISELKLLLPVGISFYTFQTMSYTIDVYNERTRPEPNFITFALFVTYWPQLVAGPIERSDRLIPQLKSKPKFEVQNLTFGILKIAIGMFKKVVIADRAAVFANMVFNDLDSFAGAQIGLATLMFSIQIYCDFSGYSDIAIGSAKLFGVNLMENFKAPYLANSFSDFWRRWHISLSTWFRDYVYIPLGGSKKSKLAIKSTMATFLVSGLWHGANWTFVIWGGLHGLLLILERRIKISKKQLKLPKFFQVAFVFTIINLSWIFFRINNLSDLLIFTERLLKFDLNQLGWYIYGDYKDELIILICCVSLLFIFDLKSSKIIEFYQKNYFTRVVLIFFILIAIAFFGVFHNQSEFIYFQF